MTENDGNCEGEGPVLAAGGDWNATAEAELDRVCAALGHPRRRRLCHLLRERAEWSLSDLTARIAAREGDVPIDEVSDRRADRVHVSLYHSHVPQLAADGVVAFDEATETVTPGENATRVLAVLDATSDEGDRGGEVAPR